jgi:hypothetical protein
MRVKPLQCLLTTIVLCLMAVPASAGPWDATVQLGGIVVDEQGDRSTVQETYNIYDGFNVTRLRLSGNPGVGNYLLFDLREINLDSRKGNFLFRRPGTFRLTGRLDQHRQVFDPDRSVNADRTDWNFGARFTPRKWVTLTADYNLLRRDGHRLSFPEGAESVLGTQYDSNLHNGRLAAELQKDGRGLAVDYRISNYSDKLNDLADRTGQVVAVRAYAPGYFYDKATHMVRGAYGKSELDTGGLDYTLSRFEYTGVVRPVRVFQFKYNFDIQRVDNKSTMLKTDRIMNDFTATYFHPYGSVYATYGYETNDDDKALTNYNSWGVGGTARNDKVFAQVRYSGRDKDVPPNNESSTLLEDLEASRVLGRLEVKPVEGLFLSGNFNVRQREFPVVHVKSEGETYGGTVRYDYRNWGGLSGTYTYANEDYTDRAGNFKIRTHVVTGRVDVKYVQDLVLGAGVTHYAAERDMDIEKSILFFDGRYSVREDLHFDVKYNIYNYDDFMIRDRYYTANVVWFNVAYDLHVD